MHGLQNGDNDTDDELDELVCSSLTTDFISVDPDRLKMLLKIELKYRNHRISSD